MKYCFKWHIFHLLQYKYSEWTLLINLWQLLCLWPPTFVNTVPVVKCLLLPLWSTSVSVDTEVLKWSKQLPSFRAIFNCGIFVLICKCSLPFWQCHFSTINQQGNSTLDCLFLKQLCEVLLDTILVQKNFQWQILAFCDIPLYFHTTSILIIGIICICEVPSKIARQHIMSVPKMFMDCQGQK